MVADEVHASPFPPRSERVGEDDVATLRCVASTSRDRQYISYFNFFLLLRLERTWLAKRDRQRVSVHADPISACTSPAGASRFPALTRGLVGREPVSGPVFVGASMAASWGYTMQYKELTVSQRTPEGGASADLISICYCWHY